MQSHDINFKTADGIALRGALVRPKGRPKAAVVLHGATGVPHGYYCAFAEWLATERDCVVLTYDYRDFGASARGKAAASRATMSDWGLLDQPAALTALRHAAPGVPIWVIGHSLGGLMLGFQPQMAGVERVITVASGMVRLGDHPWPFRAKAAAFWYGHGPILVRLAGYLPRRWSGFGADLPAGVFWQWRRWCTGKTGFLRDVGLCLPMPDVGVVTAAVTFVAVADDDMMPPAAVWRLMAHHGAAFLRQRVLRPADFGLARIGHVGAFARRNAVVWPAIVD
jgi:predicted alpha/beta hydrolase